MDVFTMVVVIVAIVFGAGAFNNYLKTRRQEAAQADDGTLAEDLARLSQRVAVLEQIVTDEKYQLQRDIAALAREPDSSGELHATDDAAARLR